MEMQERELDAKAKRAQLANYYAGVAGTSVRSDYGNTPEVSQSAEIGQLEAQAFPIITKAKTQEVRDRFGEQEQRFKYDKELATLKINHSSHMKAIDYQIKMAELALAGARNSTDLLQVEGNLAIAHQKAKAEQDSIIGTDIDPVGVNTSIEYINGVMQKVIQQRAKLEGRGGQGVSRNQPPVQGSAAPPVAAPAPTQSPVSTEDAEIDARLQ
jgi:hypothetical protein